MSSWEALSLPVLRYLWEHEPDARLEIDENEAAMFSVDRKQLAAEVKRLLHADYISAHDVSTLAGPGWVDINLTERGMQAIGQGPRKRRLGGAARDD